MSSSLAFNSLKDSANLLLKTIIEDDLLKHLAHQIVADRLHEVVQRYNYALTYASNAKAKAQIFKNLIKAYELLSKT